MKIGDQKQAIVLGVVALGAVLFLGKTLLGTFSGGAPQPSAPVEQPQARTTSPVVSNSPTELGSSTQTASTVPEAKEEPKDQPVQIELYRDSFAVPVKKKPLPLNKPTGKPVKQPRPLEVGSFSPVDPGMPSIPSAKSPEGNNGPVENTSFDRNLKKEESEPTKSLEIRYEGFVEASSPMAIISVDGKQMTVDPGEKISGSIKVLSIKDDHIVVVVKGVRRTVWLGKGVSI